MKIYTKPYSLVLPRMKQLKKSHCIHANLVAFQGNGFLITGKPGAGKSLLTYQLLLLGGTLIADDMVRLVWCNNMLTGQLPNPDFNGLLHLREHGLIDVRQRFGTRSACEQHAITHHLHLE